MTLLDLSLEPVVNSGEPDEESIQEFKPEEWTVEWTDRVLNQQKDWQKSTKRL